MSQPTSPANPSDGTRAPGAAADLAVTTTLAAGSGLVAGLACWVFLAALDGATDLRLDHPNLIWFLPLIGLAVGAAYHLVGGRAGEGSALLLDEIHQPTAWVPRRMAPLVGVGTVVSHLFGASVGREGTALQLSGSLTDAGSRLLRLDAERRRTLLIASLGGGFGAVFGVPLAGTVFALEVQSVRRVHLGRLGRAVRARLRPARPGSPAAGPPAAGPPPAGPTGTVATIRDRRVRRAALPTLVAALVGDRVVRILGRDHPHRPTLAFDLAPGLLLRVAVVAVAFGLASVIFVEATDLVRHGVQRWVRWAPLRPLLGGVAVLGLVLLFGRSSLGLSLPLIDTALAGDRTGLSVPFLKLAFTAVCLGSGFVGGEVTPLFVIGSTLGAALAPAVGLDPVVGASVGFVAVFGGATNTPLACTVMGAELFGGGGLAVLGLACGVAYACSGSRGVYGGQRVATVDGTVRAAVLPPVAGRLRRRPPGHEPGAAPG